jgi:DNA-binding transcriptional ArsR family regulator
MKKTLSIIIGVLALLISAGGWMLKGDAPKGLTASMFLGGIMVAICAIIAYFKYRGEQRSTDTQRVISDLKFLRLFEKQPGGLLSAEMIAEKTDLTKGEASARLSGLSTGGLLSTGTNPMGTKYFYELSAPLEEIPGLTLSGEPYLTIEDLQEIFIAYDYKVSPHDLIIATGLPWGIISREMKHFRKEGVIDLAYILRPGDSSAQYILLETYHRSEKLDLMSRTRINEEVKQVLYDERYLV